MVDNIRNLVNSLINKLLLRNRKNYDLSTLKCINGTYGTVDEPTGQTFTKVPINPNLSYISPDNMDEFDDGVHYSAKKFYNNITESYVAQSLKDKTRTDTEIYEIGALVLDSESFLTGRLNDSNIDGLMHLFYSAYAYHGSVFLRPDDIFFPRSSTNWSYHRQ